MINQIICPGPVNVLEDIHAFVPYTMEVVRDGAMRKSRDHHFSKVNNYAHLLHKKGSSPSGSDTKDWTAEVLYNMDEVGLDITKCRNK
eukprot:10432099-Ditylum_brightwellii.AAC.1